LVNSAELRVKIFFNAYRSEASSFKGKITETINNLGIAQINRYHGLWSQRNAPGASMLVQSVISIKPYYKVVSHLNLSKITIPGDLPDI